MKNTSVALGIVQQDVCVLVVDDDPDIVYTMKEILEWEGYTVATAGNGEEALAKLREVRPRLILLDLCMPHMDGAEFRRAQRQEPELALIPTVIMTAADRMLDKTQKLSPVECVAKPIELERLLMIVSRYCSTG